jgi:hypothetical protein
MYISYRVIIRFRCNARALTYIVEFSKKCVVVGAQTHNLMHKRLKHIHLTSATAVLLCYMLNSYT